MALALSFAAGLWFRRGNNAGPTPPRPAAATSSEQPERFPREGPRASGAIEATPLELPQPAYNTTDELCGRSQSVWTLPDASPPEARARLVRAGFDGPTVDALAAHMQCAGGTCTVDAPDALLRRLPSAARGRLYRELAATHGQTYASIPFRRPRAFAPWAQVAPTPATRALFSDLTWTERNTDYFADLTTACRTLTDHDERVAFVSLVRRRYSHDVRVRVTPDLDPVAVARYWTLPGRPIDVARVERLRQAQARGEAIALRELLESWPARRLNHYPEPGEPERDCFWTALHFATPERDVAIPATQFAAELAAGWREVPRTEARFGDALVFAASAEPTHAAIYLADDLIFTKNGRTHSRPWSAQHLADVLGEYPETTLRVYRAR